MATAITQPGADGRTEPDVQFGEGRRPETATHVRVEGFEGPLGLLLSLIEARQLDVLTVPLGALAGAYLEALAGLDADRIGNVSAFVAVAAQLILIKSRAMLPRHAEDAVSLRDPFHRGSAGDGSHAASFERWSRRLSMAPEVTPV